MDAASIRVNATTLKEFPGRVIRVIGKVTAVDSFADTATLDAGGSVNVSTHGADEFQEGSIYEVIGKVNVSDYKINSYSVLKLSDSVDIGVANKLAAMVPRVPELFY